MSIKNLFRSDPTRQLEEVQKVNARQRAETDVVEFHETESARHVLTELGKTIQTHPGNDGRFLYLHATFGSGKTHLLKLIGLVADRESEFAHLGTRLAQQWTGFDNLSQSIEDSHVDRLKPVFLNLLDRDASKEPPLPFLIFEAIGRELGYPTDPNWLLEWAWTVDMEYEGIWEGVQEFEHNGQTFDEVLKERATLRRWLYNALPAMAETSGTDLNSKQRVKDSIETAVADVDPSSFDADELVNRVETVTASLNEGGTRTELLLGLDEVALFVGDSRPQFWEFEETIDALQHGPNPVVVTTGQYPLPETREKLIGKPPENHWTHRQILLEGADTEIIVRKRWLQKDPGQVQRVSTLLSSLPDLSLDTYSSVESADPDPVESYPFREYDLPLLRQILQELITQGRETDRDYIQGRALLVLVRSLFTKFDWASAEEGALVTWDELFDLLIEETTYVPLWVQEMLDNTLIPTFDGDEEANEVRAAKALYLLNQAPAVPSTPENLGRLMVDRVDASLESVIEETREDLEELVSNRKVLEETNDKGDTVFTLVSEDQESVLKRAQRKAQQVSPHQLSAWLEKRLQENDTFLRSDNSLQHVDIGTERLVPLRYEYSILDSVGRAPTTKYDSIRVRILADEEDAIDDQISVWQDVNKGKAGGEHILIAIDVKSTLDTIRNVIGMGQVLDEETEDHEELRKEYRTDKRRLEASLGELLEEASVYTVDSYEGTRPTAVEQVVEEQVQAVFGSTRRTLSRPLLEVDDARALSKFFHGSGEWPLADSDAVTLGVDTSTAELTDDGWCRDVIETYSPQTAVDVETLLRQTETANGDYRGTPQESIAALLITLAMSNERVALKHDTEYVTDPDAVGRQVRTKGGLTSLQVRFDKVIIPPGEIRSVVSTLLGSDPRGDDPDDWIDEVETWVADNSVSIKRTFKEISREFDVALDALEDALSPAYSGDEISAEELVTDSVTTEAETFMTARDLFVSENGEPALWDQFTDSLEYMGPVYPSATITSGMQQTAESGTVPTTATVQTRLADATGHRVDVLAEQYRRLTGANPSESEPEAICSELSEWVQNNESSITQVLEDATATFDDVTFDSLRSVFESAWENEEIAEPDLATTAVQQQAETYETVRDLLTGDPSPWAQLSSKKEGLQADHPKSPTTESVEKVLAASRPPSLQRVRQLIKEADDPRTGGDVWEDLKAIAGELNQELPNAALTEEVTTLVEKDDRPTDDQATALLEESEQLVARIRAVENTLDDLEEGSIVLIED